MVYFSLTGLYSLYLNKAQNTGAVFTCAPITNIVAKHAQKVCEFLGYDIKTSQNFSELSIAFEVNGNYVANIVEGCSSVGVMILFLAFIIAFSGKFKTTILFGIFGLILIYITNIFRIVLMTLAIYHYPEYQNILHDIVFPGIIYGMVFLLWVIWVRKFAIINKKEK